MDAYDRCTNLGKKNLAHSVAIYGRGRELFRPPMYEKRGNALTDVSVTNSHSTHQP